MIKYKVNIKVQGLHKKENLNRIVQSIFDNNKYTENRVVIEKKNVDYSSGKVVTATVEIYDFREHDDDVEPIDVRFDRFPYTTNTDVSVEMTIFFINATTDQMYTCSKECTDLCSRLIKRQNNLISENHSMTIFKGLDSKRNWVKIICTGSRLTIPLIYI